MERFTLVISFIVYSGFSQYATTLNSLTQFIVAIIFWVLFFWWFDSTFISVRELQEKLEKMGNNEDKNDDKHDSGNSN